MEYGDIINIVTSVVVCISTVISVIIAVIAIMQTKKQIELSNKQNLFKDRIRLYLLFKGLENLYKENKKEIESQKEDNIYFNYEFLFYGMINNSYLESIGNVMKNPLQNPEQKNFLQALEKLQNNAEEMKFLFNGEIGSDIKRFIMAYAELLMSLYKYKILLYKMEEYAKSFPYVDINKAGEDMKEKEHRKSMFKCFDKINDAYKKLESYDIESELTKKIELNI